MAAVLVRVAAAASLVSVCVWAVLSAAKPRGTTPDQVAGTPATISSVLVPSYQRKLAEPPHDDPRPKTASEARCVPKILHSFGKGVAAVRPRLPTPQAVDPSRRGSAQHRCLLGWPKEMTESSGDTTEDDPNRSTTRDMATIEWSVKISGKDQGLTDATMAASIRRASPDIRIISGETGERHALPDRLVGRSQSPKRQGSGATLHPSQQEITHSDLDPKDHSSTDLNVHRHPLNYEKETFDDVDVVQRRWTFDPIAEEDEEHCSTGDDEFGQPRTSSPSVDSPSSSSSDLVFQTAISTSRDAEEIDELDLTDLNEDPEFQLLLHEEKSKEQSSGGELERFHVGQSCSNLKEEIKLKDSSLRAKNMDSPMTILDGRSLATARSDDRVRSFGAALVQDALQTAFQNLAKSDPTYESLECSEERATATTVVTKRPSFPRAAISKRGRRRLARRGSSMQRFSKTCSHILRRTLDCKRGETKHGQNWKTKSSQGTPYAIQPKTKITTVSSSLKPNEPKTVKPWPAPEPSGTPHGSTSSPAPLRHVESPMTNINALWHIPTLSGKPAQDEMSTSAGPRCYLTIAFCDLQATAALVMAHSLKSKTPKEICVLTTDNIILQLKQQLSEVFHHVYVTSELCSHDDLALSLLGRPELGVTFTKLHCWRLTQYQKCVFLDADTLVLQNCDELFDREELSAVPDTGWPDCFNSGVFVFRPSLVTYAKLVGLAISKGSFDGADQGLLNTYFGSWRSDLSRRLPFVYNVVSSLSYTYAPAYMHYASGVKIVHFAGSQKPWSVRWRTDTGDIERAQTVQNLQEPIIKLWIDIFRERVLPRLSEAAKTFAYHSTTTTVTQILHHINPIIFKTTESRTTSEHDYSRHQLESSGSGIAHTTWIPPVPLLMPQLPPHEPIIHMGTPPSLPEPSLHGDSIVSHTRHTHQEAPVPPPSLPPREPIVHRDPPPPLPEPSLHGHSIVSHTRYTHQEAPVPPPSLPPRELIVHRDPPPPLPEPSLHGDSIVSHTRYTHQEAPVPPPEPIVHRDPPPPLPEPSLHEDSITFVPHNRHTHQAVPVPPPSLPESHHESSYSLPTLEVPSCISFPPSSVHGESTHANYDGGIRYESSDDRMTLEEPVDPHWEALLWHTVQSPWEPPEMPIASDYPLPPSQSHTEESNLKPSFGWFSVHSGATPWSQESFSEIRVPSVHEPPSSEHLHTSVNEEASFATDHSRDETPTKDDVGDVIEPVPEVEETEETSMKRMKSWEEGDIDYLGKDRFENIWKKIEMMFTDPEPESELEELKEGLQESIANSNKHNGSLVSSLLTDDGQSEDLLAAEEPEDIWPGYPEGDFTGMIDWQEGRIDYCGRDRSDNILRRIDLIISGALSPIP